MTDTQSTAFRAAGADLPQTLRRAVRCLALLGFLALSAAAADSPKPPDPISRPQVVFLIGEDEYRTWETLPAFAETELHPRGLGFRVIQADPVNKHRFPGLVDALGKADLLVVSVRRRALGADELAAVRGHVEAGRPLVGIRTASHAFSPRNEDARAGDSWPEFDGSVLGGNYQGHHGVGPAVKLRVAPGAETHPILLGVPAHSFASQGSLYRVSPLRPGAVPLLLGEIPGKPPEPVAWTHTALAGRGRVFYTSLGHPDDFAQPAFRRLLANGMLWALDRPTSDTSRAASAPPSERDLRDASPSQVRPPQSGRGGAPEKIEPAARPLAPSESARRFTVVDGLEMELVLSEPEIAQPLQVSFDERGRLWVVEYRQYPAPAGLTLVSHDQFWRAVYDRVPEPPPHGVCGADRISIHEDTNGDGLPDRHTVFVDGLNIATAAARGRGGVWVLNPPYLLFYPDRNDDDVPDGDPEVHLEGFGLEDTHSVINSLRWGPDGWLYAAQGSTVSGRVRRPGAAQEPIHTLGQNIWRYHPEQRRYGVFSEGGGNAFGVEIDDRGRIFSGHNGGNTRGFHYVQGGYLQKGFEKHGQLSNPHAYGYFPQMPHNDAERFTHTFAIYGGGALSGVFDGRLFGIEPLQGRVVMAELQREGSTFRTRDVGFAVTSADPWFKPVDIKHGPDGALYVVDWYDFQVNHWRNYQGNMDAGNGRIYRLKARGARPVRAEDLRSVPVGRLVALLGSPNRWARQTALRLLGDRRDPSAVPLLRQRLAESRNQEALEALWGLHLSGGFDADAARLALDHPHPAVREWAVRLLGDPASALPDGLLERWQELARRETDPEVRQQLAASARRLPTRQALAVLRELVRHDEDSRDARQPLMIWWALEAKAGTDRAAVVEWFRDATLWERPLVRDHLLERVMRRFAQAATPEDLAACTTLLGVAPSRAQADRLLAGFEKAFEGRSMAGLPPDLVAMLARAGGGSPALQLRTGAPGAVDDALDKVADESVDAGQRTQLIQLLGERKEPRAVRSLLRACGSPKEPVQVAALGALRAFDGPQIAERAVSMLEGATNLVRTAALSLLTSRVGWSLQLARAVDGGRLKPTAVTLDAVRQMKRHDHPELAALMGKHWPATGQPTSADMEARIRDLAAIVRNGTGDPYAGKKLFTAQCAACHKLFAVGGSIGPDLTPFRRDDLDSLLLSVVHPSAEVREGYENHLVETRDDRALSGFIVRQDKTVVVLRGLDGQDVVLPREEIVEMRPAGLSLMPEGLLDGMNETQIRDFFAYLRSSQPLAN